MKIQKTARRTAVVSCLALAAACTLFFAVTSAAGAQSWDAFDIQAMKRINQWPSPPDGVVEQMDRIARENMDKIDLPGITPAALESAQKAETRILSPEDRSRIVRQGIVSVYAEWCGFNWQEKSYYPMMRAEQAKKRTDFEMAYIGLLHGATMRHYEQRLAVLKPCSKEARQKVQESL